MSYGPVPNMPTAQRLAAYLQNPADTRDPAWWIREMRLALDRGRVQWIPTREGTDLYLARFWITEPQLDIMDEGEPAESLVLHYFARGDDDRSLHDHPWDFETTILNGWYREHLPPDHWLGGDRILGPAWDVHVRIRIAGDQVKHQAASLHCVGEVAPNTVTLVRTGPQVRKWGFHPPGERWLPSDTFLDRRRSMAASA